MRVQHLFIMISAFFLSLAMIVTPIHAEDVVEVDNNSEMQTCEVKENTMIGTLDISSFIESINEFETANNVFDDYENVEISSLLLEIDGVFTIPETIDPTSITSITTNNTVYEIQNYSIESNQINIVFQLKDLDTITNYQVFKDRINMYDDIIVDIKNDSNYDISLVGEVNTMVSFNVTINDKTYCYGNKSYDIDDTDDKEIINDNKNNHTSDVDENKKNKKINKKDNKNVGVETSASNTIENNLVMMTIAGAGITIIHSLK